jgi:hypothetical protein
VADLCRFGFLYSKITITFGEKHFMTGSGRVEQRPDMREIRPVGGLIEPAGEPTGADPNINSSEVSAEAMAAFPALVEVLTHINEFAFEERVNGVGSTFYPVALMPFLKQFNREFDVDDGVSEPMFDRKDAPGLVVSSQIEANEGRAYYSLTFKFSGDKLVENTPEAATEPEPIPETDEGAAPPAFVFVDHKPGTTTTQTYPFPPSDRAHAPDDAGDREEATPVEAVSEEATPEAEPQQSVYKIEIVMPGPKRLVKVESTDSLLEDFEVKTIFADDKEVGVGDVDSRMQIIAELSKMTSSPDHQLKPRPPQGLKQEAAKAKWIVDQVVRVEERKAREVAEEVAARLTQRDIKLEAKAKAKAKAKAEAEAEEADLLFPPEQMGADDSIGGPIDRPVSSEGTRPSVTEGGWQMDPRQRVHVGVDQRRPGEDEPTERGSDMLSDDRQEPDQSLVESETKLGPAPDGDSLLAETEASELLNFGDVMYLVGSTLKRISSLNGVPRNVNQALVTINRAEGVDELGAFGELYEYSSVAVVIKREGAKNSYAVSADGEGVSHKLELTIKDKFKKRAYSGSDVESYIQDSGEELDKDSEEALKIGKSILEFLKSANTGAEDGFETEVEYKGAGSVEHDNDQEARPAYYPGVRVNLRPIKKRSR